MFCETVFFLFLEIVLIIDQIETERFFLRCLSPDENLDRYLGWMQNVDSFPFIESTNSDYNEDDLKKYIKNINNSSNSIQFSIFEKVSISSERARKLKNCKIVPSCSSYGTYVIFLCQLQQKLGPWE